MGQLIEIKQELQGIEESKAKQIQECFEPMVQMLTAFEKSYDEVVKKEISPQVCHEAKRLRLDISKVRIEADKVRKAQKEQYLRAGNAIQGVYNILRYAVEDKENHLKGIETHYERIEAERIAKLQEERSREILEFGEFTGIDFGSMTDEVWNNFLLGAKAAHQAKLDAERKAEEDRIKAEKEAERKRKEEEKKRIAEAAKKAKEEAERKAKEEAERRKREHEEALEAQRRKAAEEKRQYEQKLEEQRRQAEEEKKREAEQKRQEQERREQALKNKQHKEAIESEAVSYLISADVPVTLAKTLIGMIASGRVPHVQMVYWKE